jgi:hypothetical protein
VSAVFWNGILVDHAAAQVLAAPPARDTYRGWDIWQGRWPEPAWSATGPNYDASYEGPEDGWVASGGSAYAATRADLIEEIDIWIEEHSE